MAGLQKTRKQILELLKINGTATVSDLADGLGIAPVSVRHHLALLMEEGLVAHAGSLNSEGAGRPRVLYKATPKAGRYFPADYRALVGYLMEELETRLPSEQLEEVLRGVARRILADSPETLQESGNIEKRLDAATRFLSERGYLARWKKDEDGTGYYLLVHNCPYSDVHRSAFCYMDRWLITILLQREVKPLPPDAHEAISCGYFVPAQQERGE